MTEPKMPLSMVSKGGHEVATAQVSAVQQIDHSQDVLAQTSLTNAMAAAKTLFIDAGTYDGIGPAELRPRAGLHVHGRALTRPGYDQCGHAGHHRRPGRDVALRHLLLHPGRRGRRYHVRLRHRVHGHGRARRHRRLLVTRGFGSGQPPT